MRIVTDEVFGPILPVLIAETEEKMVEMANASSYGLGAAIFTRDLAKGERLAREIEAGFVAVNDLVKSDPRLPFVGIKKSGIGRELSPYPWESIVLFPSSTSPIKRVAQFLNVFTLSPFGSG
jgi:acyl-CoA reductase-like NAD-dependent aldehyde dehydrogenase